MTQKSRNQFLRLQQNISAYETKSSKQRYIRTEMAVGEVARDECQLLKRRDVGTFGGRLSVVGHGAGDWVANYDQQSYVGIHLEDPLHHTTADQIARSLLHRQLTRCRRRHPRSTCTQPRTS